MKTSSRVALNSIILYMKVIVCILISLVSVPIILKTLGSEDYGLYTLIAGAISMLSFLNSSMALSVQRYISVAIGEKNWSKVQGIYNASIILHFLLAIFVVFLIEIISFFFFGELNINPNRFDVAWKLLHILATTIFVTIISVPFDSILIANENMVMYSVFSIMDNALKLFLALFLYALPGDKLLAYGLGLVCVSVCVFITKYLFIAIHYRNYEINIRKYYDRKLLVDITKFTGWNCVAALSVMIKNQGSAITLNSCFGTIVNAAYGLANQVNGALSYFSTSIQNSINPQIMKSEGMNDRNRLVRLAGISSKFSSILLSLFAIPLIIKMPEVLNLWLSEVPDYTITITRFILVIAILSQFSVGMQSAIVSIGEINYYFRTVSSINILSFVIASILLIKLSFVEAMFSVYCLSECLLLIVRLFYCSKIKEFSVANYIRQTVGRLVVVIVISFLFAFLTLPVLTFSNKFLEILLFSLCVGIFYSIMIFLIALDKDEKIFSMKLIKALLNKIRNEK